MRELTSTINLSCLKFIYSYIVVPFFYIVIEIAFLHHRQNAKKFSFHFPLFLFYDLAKKVSYLFIYTLTLC